MGQYFSNFLVSVCAKLNEKEDELSQKLMVQSTSSQVSDRSNDIICSSALHQHLLGMASSHSSVLNSDPGEENVLSCQGISIPFPCPEDCLDLSNPKDVFLISYIFYREFSNGSEECEFQIVPLIQEFKQDITSPQAQISDNKSAVPVQDSKKKARRRCMKKAEPEKITKGVVSKEIWLMYYSNHQKILLVGEGDFSFSASLAAAFGSASNLTATSLDSIGTLTTQYFSWVFCIAEGSPFGHWVSDFLSSNYKNALDNIQKLTDAGCLVMHEVDATIMALIGLFNHKTFDRIVFNFPHAGFSNRNRPQDLQILQHQQLISGFLLNAKKLIGDGGEIHLSHKTNGFHQRWGLETLASRAGLQLIGKVRFNVLSYPGYTTKYGYGGDNNFDCNPSETYKFGF